MRPKPLASSRKFASITWMRPSVSLTVTRGFVARHVGLDHLVAVADLGAGPSGGVGQHLVEGGALHLVRAAPAGRELVAEVEVGVLAVAGEGRAVLVLEAGLDHGLQHAGGLDVLHALRQQALADGKARELLAFDDQHPAPLLAQQARGDRAGRARADDEDVGVFGGSGHGTGPWERVHEKSGGRPADRRRGRPARTGRGSLLSSDSTRKPCSARRVPNGCLCQGSRKGSKARRDSHLK